MECFDQKKIKMELQHDITSRMMFASDKSSGHTLNLKAPNTTKAAFANTVDPDENAHDEPSHLDLQCLPPS